MSTLYNRSLLFLILALFLLSSCTLQSPTTSDAPTVTPKPPTSSPTSIAIPTPNPSEPLTEYRDDSLCFVVEVPSSWMVDGTRGGFASFAPQSDQPMFNVSNVSLGESPTLDDAQENLQQGSLGAYVDEIKKVEIDKQAARWVTFTQESEFQFVVLLIAPDCGDGLHPLFISAASIRQEYTS